MAVTYQGLYDKFGHFNFGLPLPAEIYAPPYLTIAEDVTMVAALFVLLMSAAASWRHGRFLVIPAALICIIAADLSRISLVPKNEYRIEMSHNRLKIDFRPRLRAAYVQLGHLEKIWPEQDRFAVTVIGNTSPKEWAALSANQVISFSCDQNISTVTIRNFGNLDFMSEINFRLVVYKSDSLLRNSVSILRASC